MYNDAYFGRFSKDYKVCEFGIYFFLAYLAKLINSGTLLIVHEYDAKSTEGNTGAAASQKPDGYFIDHDG